MKTKQEFQEQIFELQKLPNGNYKCHFSGEEIQHGNEKYYGGCIPNHGYKVIVSDSKTTKELIKDSRIAFDESEANCNTCKHLQRIKHEKCQFGFLQGKCEKTNEDLRFHPDDPMHMECYESRRENK